jgi:hypothetical protein
MLRLRMNRAMPPLLQMYSWHGAQLSTETTFPLEILESDGKVTSLKIIKYCIKNTDLTLKPGEAVRCALAARKKAY